VRSHGWSGNAPTSDEEAIERILDAVDAILAEDGASMRIADVARTLGVTRQTVYRYFPGTDALLIASAMRSADGFINRLEKRVGGLTDPVAAMVESVSFAAEELIGDRQFENLITRRQEGGSMVSLTSETGMTFQRSIMHRFDVDWAAHGFDDAAVDELGELGLRTLHSLLIDPGEPPREGAELRRFVARWLGPAILYPRLQRGVEAVQSAAD
jgi:AcrR family transcriptional regulator